LVIGWILAIVAARYVALPAARFAIHIVLAFAFFIAVSTGIFLVLDYREPPNTSVPFSVTMDFILKLGGIAVAAAFADGLIRFWKDQRVARSIASRAASS
jgi:hypothetical protein